MYCQNCGSQLPDSAKFCDRCGAKVGSATEQNSSQTEYNMASIMVNKKSEALSLILSLLIPGLGQIYNGQIKKGAIMLVAAIVCAFVMFLFFPLAFLYLVLWIYGMYDAFKDAKEYNHFFSSRSARFFNSAVSGTWGMTRCSCPRRPCGRAASRTRGTAVQHGRIS